MLPSPTPKIRSRQIIESDIHAVVTLLAKGFPVHSHQFWLRVFESLAKHSTPVGLPKYGHLLECNDVPVGVILQIFSTIPAATTSTTRCNISSWYVEPAFRTYAAALVSQALKPKNVTYLNITAAPHTRATVQAQGFSRYSSGVFVAIPALSSRSNATPATVVAGHICPEVHFESFERDLLLDHGAYGCMTLWCVTCDRAFPFVFRPRVIRGFMACTHLIYCRDIEDFIRFARPIGMFLAMRGKPLVIVDSNAAVPGLVGKYLDGRMPKYFMGPDRPRLGDLAYTEAAMFGV